MKTINIVLSALNKNSRKMVYNYYADDINKLEKLINRDLSAWKKL